VLGEVDALKSFRGDIEGESRQAVIHGELEKMPICRKASPLDQTTQAAAITCATNFPKQNCI
jgi:hypothetical protein